MKRTGVTVTCLAITLVLTLGATAWADDDPLAPPAAEEGAPPAPDSKKPNAPEADAAPQTPIAEEPAPADATPPVKTPPPAKGEGWGTPDASPTRDVATDLLPPPVVRNPAARGTPTPTRPTTTMPIVAGDDATPLLPSDAFDVDPALIPGVPKTPARPVIKAATPAGARIHRITKVHNVRLGNGSPALRLDIEFGASGQQGRELFLAAGFSRSDTRTPIRSLVPAFAGRSGTVVARTEPVRIRANGRYRASLWVPYGAFPSPPAGSAYGVQTLVQLLRKEADGRETVMAHDSATFTVHGPATR